MNRIFVLKNEIQDYAWGSLTAIPRLLGLETPAETPQAELWMGAHPKAPSRVHYDKQWLPLNRFIAAYPDEILGSAVHRKFGPYLPFLFKVLAAAEPLSLQAHPNRIQARQGFRRENDLGIPLDAPHRNYKDDQHKPECLCALTPFWGLRGFRKLSRVFELADTLGAGGVVQWLEPLKTNPNSEGLKQFFRAMMTAPPPQKQAVVREATEKAAKKADQDPIFHWMTVLADAYPDDIGILAPVLLNLIRLAPGQAMFLPAGELHAYLEGLGIELMANSDNVLRGGLTPKHIDVEEVLNVLVFEESTPDILTPPDPDALEYVYGTPAEEFVLSVIAVGSSRSYESPARRSVEIVICTEGEAEIIAGNPTEPTPLSRGISLLIPAAVPRYRIEGQAVIYKAAVPL
jgi:mannose-6-phosphate isomerase